MQYLSLQQGAQKVLRLSQHMLAHAQAGNWELMSNLELERTRSLESLFRHPQITDSLPEIANILYEVMEIDRLCLDLGEHARQSILKNLNKQSQGSRATNSYLQHAR